MSSVLKEGTYKRIIMKAEMSLKKLKRDVEAGTATYENLCEFRDTLKASHEYVKGLDGNKFSFYFYDKKIEGFVKKANELIENF